MIYSPKSKANPYKTVSVQTASPGRIVLMLFEGILRFTGAAKAAFNDPKLETVRRNEQISNNLIRAQRIVTELQANLDMNVPGELPQTLYKLYDYFFGKLNEANIHKRIEAITEIEPMVQELCNSWAEMLTKHEAENPAGQPVSGPAPTPGQSGSGLFRSA
ncbi:MAG: flagellar export chaperone FliS [Opitutales bacterium]